MIREPQRAESGEIEVRIRDYSIRNTDKEKLLAKVGDIIFSSFIIAYKRCVEWQPYLDEGKSKL